MCLVFFKIYEEKRGMNYLTLKGEVSNGHPPKEGQVVPMTKRDPPRSTLLNYPITSTLKRWGILNKSKRTQVL
ncbi:MAG: hypothetical protein ACI83D_000073 [Planctomycetota bacterium]|jgi:hypothetical protein